MTRNELRREREKRIEIACKIKETEPGSTGRLIHSGKRGAIPAHLAPILARLDLDFDTWLTTMCSPSRFLGGAIGSAAARTAEAVRRGIKWVVDRTKIHKPPDAA